MFSRANLKLLLPDFPFFCCLNQVQQVDTQAELEQILSTSGDSLVVIDFTATWCSPCQKIAPAFEQLSQELAEVVFVKVDVDENEVRKKYATPLYRTRPSTSFSSCDQGYQLFYYRRIPHCPYTGTLV